MSIGIPRIRDVNTEDLAGVAKTLVAGDAYFQNLDAGGTATSVNMPALFQGAEVFITNTGGETITVYAADATTTLASLLTTESVTLICNGTAWETTDIQET